MIRTGPGGGLLRGIHCGAAFAATAVWRSLLRDWCRLILFLGGIGAFVRTYRVWRAEGSGPSGRPRGGFCCMLFLFCLGVPFSARGVAVSGHTHRVSSPPPPLAGVRIVEISSFVAVPLAGMTLAALGAEVVRIDPVGGAADYHRWPLTDAGDSIYWAGLNKGKRSMAVDMRTPEQGQQLVATLIVDGRRADHQCGRAAMAFV